MSDTIPDFPSGLTPRVKRLRDIALARKVSRPFDLTILEADIWRRTAGEPWWILRKGLKNQYLLEHVAIELDPDELLAGRLSMRAPDESEKARLAEAQAYLGAQPPSYGQRGHAQVDMEKLLTLGALGVQDEIRERMRGLDESVSDQQKRLKFYEACLCSLDGLMRFAERYAALAEDLAAGESDPQRRPRRRHLFSTRGSLSLSRGGGPDRLGNWN